MLNGEELYIVDVVLVLVDVCCENVGVYTIHCSVDVEEDGPNQGIYPSNRLSMQITREGKPNYQITIDQ